MSRRWQSLCAILIISVVSAACSTTSKATITTSTTAVTSTTSTAAPSTTPATTTTTSGPYLLAEPAAATCAEFAATPFPDRRAVLEQQSSSAGATADDLLASMRTMCPQVVSDFEDLEDIAAKSAQLGADVGFSTPSVVVTQCDPEVSATIVNDWDFEVGLIAALYRGDDSSHVDGFEIVVFPSVKAGESVEVSQVVAPSSTSARCGVSARAFVATPDSDATDTWEPAADQRALPATSGEDWLQIMQALVDTEIASHNDGLAGEFGMTEDARSAEYSGLVADATGSDQWPATQIDAICDATLLADDLVNITYVATADGETYTSAGLFRKSPQDGRWRWLQLSFFLSEGNACDNFGGVSVPATGIEV